METYMLPFEKYEYFYFDNGLVLVVLVIYVHYILPFSTLGHRISLVKIRNTFLTLTPKLICHRRYFSGPLLVSYKCFQVQTHRSKISFEGY
jgi:hypothetical protein